MDVGNHHGEVGEEKKLHRAMGEAERHQRLVEEAVASQKRDPRDHSDDVGCPEGHRAEQKECDLPEDVPHVEDEKVGNRKADHERDGPDNQRVLDGLRVERVGQG